MTLITHFANMNSRQLSIELCDAGNFMLKARRKPGAISHRRMMRVGIGYLSGAWLLIQLANLLLPAFDTPLWIMQALIITLALGLPAALVFAVLSDLGTPDAHQTDAVLVDRSTGLFQDRRLDFVIIGILAGGLLLSSYGNFRREPERASPISILIADFENNSGSELFSGVLEEIVRVGLEVAPFIDVFPRSAAAALSENLPVTNSGRRSMDLETASVVALRQGIDIVIAGEVNRGENGLVVSVRGIAPGYQQELFSASETVANDTEILNAISGGLQYTAPRTP